MKVYWQPGCSSCLKTKEFLLANGIAFESINVLEDERGFRELEALGLKLVPIVARGRKWANGAYFRAVAELAGFEWISHEMLAPKVIVARIDGILSAAQRFIGQIPEDRLDHMPSVRPRSYRQLAYHVFQIPEVFLDHVEHEAPYTYEALIASLAEDLKTRDDLLNYGAGVQSRLQEWWARAGGVTDFSQPARVYYGEVTLHEVLERTAWHSGQHTRQLMLALTKLGIEPDQAMTEADFSGLPMPKDVWDDETTFD